ncbi:MAG TPA: class II fumarate hydratase [Candidatus Binatia bacterium]|jgi:fumarate hydratase class II
MSGDGNSAGTAAQIATRIETDTFGSVAVAAGKYWGAQTQRALEHFAIGSQTLPCVLVRALGIVKRCAALVNAELGLLDLRLADAIVRAADEVITGQLDAHFPLPVWQSGSGTQSNMNVNEVLANRSSEILGGSLGEHRLVHPNDHCNLGQSSNDVFPTAMHVAAVEELQRRLEPALDHLRVSLEHKSQVYAGLVKIGRTHLQDAVPLTLGQELSGYAAQLATACDRLHDTTKRLYPVAQGGTAVGTGLNTHAQFATRFAAELARYTGLPFVSAPNKFEALASHDTFVELSGVLGSIAAGLNKFAGDLRLLGSGPRCGIGELRLPENEPGSSIMPGKVNPSQCEAMMMVCAQVMGNQVTVAFAGAQGQLELNTFKPVIACNVLQSIELLGDAAHSLTVHCIDGLEADEARIAELVERSLMLVTALVPRLGYDRAAAIARAALANGTTLRDEAVGRGDVTAEEFDRIVRPAGLV